jgi:hypothetical protein
VQLSPCFARPPSGAQWVMGKQSTAGVSAGGSGGHVANDLQNTPIYEEGGPINNRHPVNTLVGFEWGF